jgi:hypothetical protein
MRPARTCANRSKEAELPAHAPYLPQLEKEFLHNGKRVVLGQKGLQALNDPTLGYTERWMEDITRYVK